ncbi:thioredoxin-like protein [Mucidula mucida]|nr:thioredoxin-like protein [Mucidula mucida]
MSVNPDEDTEFNDALRKYGIIPEKQAPPPSPSPPPSPTLEEMLDDFTASELKELSEDAPDDETERNIAAYRKQRLAAERKAEKKARFGSAIDEDGDTEGRGTGVVCFLYKDGLPRSERAFGHLRTLAAKYPRTKFVSIVGDKCIPNLPDSRIPMIIIYRKGEIRNQILSGAQIERGELEAILLMTNGIDLPDIPQPMERKDDEDSDDDADASSRMRSSIASTNRKAPKNIRRSDDGDDSDFEFDL